MLCLRLLERLNAIAVVAVEANAALLPEASGHDQPSEQRRAAIAAVAELLLERAIPPLALEGPAPAPLHRLKGSYRWQLLAKGPDPEALRRWVRDTLALLPSSERAKVQLSVDPVDLC